MWKCIYYTYIYFVYIYAYIYYIHLYIDIYYTIYATNRQLSSKHFLLILCQLVARRQNSILFIYYYEAMRLLMIMRSKCCCCCWLQLHFACWLLLFFGMHFQGKYKCVFRNHTYILIYHMLYVCDVCNAVNRQVIDSIVMLVFKMYLDEIAQFHRILNNIWLRLYRYLIGCVLGNVLAGILEMRSGIIGMWWWKA